MLNIPNFSDHLDYVLVPPLNAFGNSVHSSNKVHKLCITSSQSKQTQHDVTEKCTAHAGIRQDEEAIYRGGGLAYYCSLLR